MIEQGEGFRVEAADGVMTLSFDRPDRGNTISSAMIVPLTQLFERIAADRSIRTLLVRADGEHFSRGGDVNGFISELGCSTAELQQRFDTRLALGSEMVAAFRRISVPVVVACQGSVAGAGLMYPLGGDVVLGDPTAFMVFAHQRVGLTPDGGVSFLLPRVVGERVARELVLTAAKVEAPEAVRYGIFSRIVEPDALHAEALAVARRLARAPLDVVGRAKAMINASLDADIAKQLEAERQGIVASVGHPDFEEGVRAFMEKRAPAFAGAPARS